MATSERLAQLGLGQTLTQPNRGIGHATLLLRVAAATTLSYLFALSVSPSDLPVFAPITTMLVMQSSLFATVGMAVQRVIGTGVGVVIASLWVNLATLVMPDLVVFSVGIFLGLFLARQMPLGLSGQLQVSLAMVFVLALGPQAWEQDLWRVIETLVGGFIGIALLFLFPSRPRLGPAEQAMDGWATDLGTHLALIAAELDHGQVPAGHRHGFVANSEGLRETGIAAGARFTEALESVRFNPRARRVGAAVDLIDGRRRWLTSLTVQTRAMTGQIDRLYDRSGLPPALPVTVLTTLLRECAELMQAASAQPRDEVSAQRYLGQIDAQLHEAVLTVSAGRDDVYDVLDSMTILGRLQVLSRTMFGGPESLSRGDLSDAEAAAGVTAVQDAGQSAAG